MLYAKKQKTLGGFYNIYDWKVKDGVLHHERICSFYDWEMVVDFFNGQSLITGKKIEKQCFISGNVILSIKD